MNRRAMFTVAAACLLCAGCGNGFGWGRSNKYVKPTIAVMKFENRAPFALKWNLGSGMRDVLVDRLVATRRFHVIERGEIGSVMSELKFQQSGATRTQARAKPGRGKNVRYLIKGTITDFGHVTTTSAFADLDLLGVFRRSSRAVMGLTLYVVDVETFEIIASQSLCESVRASDVDVRAKYKKIAFGGSVFYQTPLGRATARVIDKAVRRICKTIASRPWVPRLADVRAQTGHVTINGGANRNVRTGDQFEVLQLGRPVIDPDSGDILGRQASKVLGRIRVRQVHDRYAIADIVDGQADGLHIGQTCRPAAGGGP